MGSAPLRASGFWLRVSLIAAVILAGASSPSAAQTRATTGDLGGIVLDQSGAVLPGASITVTNQETGVSRSAISDAEGRFSVPALQVGVYEVRADLAGFSQGIVEAVGMSLGSSVDLRITLNIASTQEQVTVTAAAAAPLDTQGTVVGTVVSQQQIDSLPINRRNFVSFALITPGVAVDRVPNQGAAASSGLVFSGQRGRSNNITVDGLDNNDLATGGVRATFSQEAVREFQVLTNSYSAEFGKASGGVLNIVTRSGTNAFSGGAFFYVRDKALDSKGYFERFDPAGRPVDREKAPFTQVQTGGVFGGPLRRNRTFFFLSFERLDVRTTSLVTINDSTLVPDPRGGPPLGTPAGILRQAGFPLETGFQPLSQKGHQFLAKVDHEIASSQHLVLRVNSADLLDENIEPWGGLVARSRGAALDAVDHAVAATHSMVPSGRLVNEARFQYAYRDQAVDSLDPTCPLPCSREDQGGPTVSIGGTGFVGRQQFTPQPRTARRYQFVDTVSYFTGDHQVKAGVDFNVVDTAARLPLAFGGQYVFAALPLIPGLTPSPVSAVQAFALGIPALYVQGFGNSDASFGYQDLSLFVQDEWRLRPSVTVKTGLRYQAQFWPRQSYDVPGIGPYSLRRDYNNIAPRLSVAWTPGEDRRTVLRGAYGIFHDNVIAAVVANAKALNGSTGVRTLQVSFPSRTPLVAWNSPGHRLTEPPPGSSFVTLSIDPDLKASYAHHASAGLDREIGGGMVASGSLVYARGLHHIGIINYNPLIPSLGPGRRPEDINGRAGTSATISQYTSYGGTWYSGLILSLSKRGRRAEFLASYTLSKAEDNVSDYIGGPQNNGLGRDPSNPAGLPLGFNPDDDRARSLSDQRHRFVVSGTYAAPWAVQLSTVLTVESGRPYEIGAGFDFNGDGLQTDRPRGNPASTALDYSSSVPRNAGTLPSQGVMDLRVQRRVPLGGPLDADVLVDVFNVFNRTNFTQVNSTFGPGAYPSEPLPTYGQFTQAGPPRQVQLALKLAF